MRTAGNWRHRPGIAFPELILTRKFVTINVVEEMFPPQKVTAVFSQVQKMCAHQDFHYVKSRYTE
jgi:hypothetical protein